MTETFWPAFAPHVVARFEPRVWNGAGHDPQRIAIRCNRCGDSWTGTCDSGRVRERTSKWAVLHLQCPISDAGSSE